MNQYWNDSKSVKVCPEHASPQSISLSDTDVHWAYGQDHIGRSQYSVITVKFHVVKFGANTWKSNGAASLSLRMKESDAND